MIKCGTSARSFEGFGFFNNKTLAEIIKRTAAATANSLRNPKVVLITLVVDRLCISAKI